MLSYRGRRHLLADCKVAFDSSPQAALYREDLDTWFVTDPASYHALRTCHEMMTVWLRELDCTIRALLWNLYWTVPESPDFHDATSHLSLPSGGNISDSSPKLHTEV